MAAEGGSSLPQSQMFEGFSGLNLMRQLGLMIGLAASVAIGFAVVLWSQGEDYKPLYANLDRMDPSAVLTILDSNQIAYKVDEKTGALMVAANQIHDARLKLAGEGISADGSFGFELMDKERPLGTSQFMENARFKRSLEGELARTITSIRQVRAARVHLAIPKTSAFVRDSRKPTASVFVDLYSGVGINPPQVRAIANLVASSIPELALQDVTVVDQRGNLLSNFETDEKMVAANRQMEYTKELEQRYVERINSILVRILGEDKFRAEVSADVDFTEIEQAEEQFNPDLPAIRSEQTLEEGRGAGGGVGGVPGALSNQPPLDGAAPENATAQGGAADAGGGSSRVQATRNYELDRTVSYTRHQTGRVRRLSVAVVVDNMVKKDATTGAMNSVPMPQEELDRLSVLVRDAVGFDAARGDSVNIINAEFIPIPEQEMELIEEQPLWQQPEMVNLAKKVLGGLFVLVIIFGVLRPVMRNLTDTSKEMRELEAQEALNDLSADLGGDLADETVTLSGGDSMLLTGPGQNYEQQINAVKGLIAEDPGRVAQVVKQWVNSGE
ncbi:flagellar M-ring protein FliF [Dasania sp. GY-MA-18]|uniref:Flagellar M-ring protein n=1 Tax=Dasania phycosphaerae TaxID=2950436 RepID=A0A9J6RI90_9GAMM|nr:MULTISPECIES: flagellar basal-body MS-ring/collar protein FliF [Dasania]MCR8921654.1 flagellar M-ring protein FliF [Dasania sp. GY-MA-18]MCZ0864082.1 flagellar basal-body MS-ring/collar protein FliF [Dasania phycosphaerae]MCZ0867810.1 flagellar basal-body MS-ring/collar protein FliF [Dasania phycosphaerae]